MARRVAPIDAAVLLRGENGTGKGVLARALHAWSKRPDGPFVTVNCPSLSPELLESDLFGHARGAFTGAVRDAAGKVAAAEGGTLFLDEVGDLPLVAPAQAPPVPPGAEVRAGRRDEHPDRRRPPRRRDQPRPRSRGRLGGVPRGPALPAQRRRDDPAPAPQADRRRRPGRPPARLLRPPGRPAPDRLHRPRPATPWPGTPGRATSASCGTPIERAAILAEGPEIGLADLPERIVPARPRARPGGVELGRPVSLEAARSRAHPPDPRQHRQPRGSRRESSGSTPARSTASGSSTGCDGSRLKWISGDEREIATKIAIGQESALVSKAAAGSGHGIIPGDLREFVSTWVHWRRSWSASAGGSARTSTRLASTDRLERHGGRLEHGWRTRDGDHEPRQPSLHAD